MEARAVAWLAISILLVAVSLPILTRRKDCITEINVILFAFSFTFLIWGAVKVVLQPNIYEQSVAMWIRLTRMNLTDPEVEISWIVLIILVAVAPQLLTYVLSGLAGTASTPKLVWQFEKIAIWSLIKFLAVAAGVLIADGMLPDKSSFRESNAIIYSDVSFWEHLEMLFSGLAALGLAFAITVAQVYFIEFAQTLGEAWKREPKSWQYRIHRFFTRNISVEEKAASESDGIIIVALVWELQRRYPSLSVEDAGRLARAYVTRASKLSSAIF
jgi:hypothetical protein